MKKIQFMAVLLTSLFLFSSHIHAQSQTYTLENSFLYQKSNPASKKKLCHYKDCPHEHEPHEEHQEEQWLIISDKQSSSKRTRRCRQRRKLCKHQP